MLVALTILLVAAGSAWAQQVTQGPHPLSALPPPGQVVTGFFFPDHPKKHFPAGKFVNVVLGFHNEATEAYNVTAIMGSLNSPTDFAIHVQNFTQQVYHQPVTAGGEISLDYKFMPDARLEPRDFVVALTVFYQDTKGQYYSNTFFNQTVEIIEIKKMIDWELLSMLAIVFGLIAGVVYIVILFCAPKLAFTRKSKKSKKSEATRSADDTEEWVKGSNYEALKKKRAAAAERKVAK